MANEKVNLAMFFEYLHSEHKGLNGDACHLIMYENSFL